MPPLIGFAAASGTLTWDAWVLFAILFLWQFPHFYAIAWMYKEDYARAGIRCCRWWNRTANPPRAAFCCIPSR
jgi:heme O synthase-like polyprenyltransferase